MKKILIIFVLFLYQMPSASAFSAESDSATEAASVWSGGVELATTNKYLWRGITVNEGFIMQPFAWLTYQNFTFSLWNNTTLNEPKDDIKRPEVDVTISYELDLQNFVFESYFSYYKYIDQSDAPNTGEIGCNLGYPFGIVTLNAGVICDVMEYSGAVYLEQKIEVEKSFNEEATAYGALTLGSGLEKFNEAYFGLSESMVNLLALEGHLTYTTGCGVYLQPYFQWNKTINSDLNDFLKKNTSAFGLTIGKEF
jgi:hypothetical protein